MAEITPLATEENTRFGIGLLQTNRQAEAEPGEAMASRSLGYVAVLSETTKKMISYDYITRFSKTYQDFKSSLIASGNIGKVGKLDITNEPATALVNGAMVSTTGLKVTDTKKLAFIRFHLDLDIVDSAAAIPVDCNPDVNIAFTVAANKDTNTSRTYNISAKLKDLNAKVFVPDYTNFETVSSSINHDFTFDSIKVTLPSGVGADTVTIVLHSLLVAFKEVA